MSYLTEFCETLRKSGIVEEFHAHSASMKPLGKLNHWRAQANKLPAPTMQGEWCISPEGVRFDAVLVTTESGQPPVLFWELCALTGRPLGLLFRETAVPRPDR